MHNVDSVLDALEVEFPDHHFDYEVIGIDKGNICSSGCFIKIHGYPKKKKVEVIEDVLIPEGSSFECVDI